jgi:hypothetical protein
MVLFDRLETESRNPLMRKSRLLNELARNIARLTTTVKCPSSEIHPGQNSIISCPAWEPFREAGLDWRGNSLLAMSGVHRYSVRSAACSLSRKWIPLEPRGQPSDPPLQSTSSALSASSRTADKKLGSPFHQTPWLTSEAPTLTLPFFVDSCLHSSRSTLTLFFQMCSLANTYPCCDACSCESDLNIQRQPTQPRNVLPINIFRIPGGRLPTSSSLQGAPAPSRSARRSGTGQLRENRRGGIV